MMSEASRRVNDATAKQGELLRGPGEGYARIPELTLPMKRTIDAIYLANNGPLCERKYRRANGKIAWAADDKNIKRVLKRLLREGLIEVMELSPAVYRVTKLGQLARRKRPC